LDAWFDDGTLRCDTGSNTYEYTDGTKAWQAVLTSLQVTIHFPNGEVVTVEQKWEQR
jgi:hypothetical protein